MKTLQETQKLANHICRLLKVNEVVFPIAKTPKGQFGLVFNSNNEGFEMILDSVPLSTKNSLEDENNIELKRMIEKYWFEQDKPAYSLSDIDTQFARVIDPPLDVTITPVKNKGGRPRKHVNSTTKETS